MNPNLYGDCVRKGGGDFRQMSTIVYKEGEGVKNRQNPVYVVCLRPLNLWVILISNYHNIELLF